MFTLQYFLSFGILFDINSEISLNPMIPLFLILNCTCLRQYNHGNTILNGTSD